LPQQERVNIAVFIDFDNIEIGVKTTLGEHFDIGVILEALKERGEVVTKIAYADWTRAGEYSRALTQHAIRLVQRNLTPGGDKNGADINLALDALEMAFTHPHINAYVIVGGDSDFLSLVEKLKQYDKKVFVVGGRAFTSIILQRNCHEFIAYENLVRKPAPKGSRPQAASSSSPIAQAFPIVRRALKILADREVSPQTGLLKSTLLQLDSTFSERTYGASSFLDFVEKLTQAGLVQLKHAGRSVMVELNPAFSDEGEVPPAPRIDGSLPVLHAQAPAAAAVPPSQASSAPEDTGPVIQAGDNAEGVRLVGQLLASATARWPMYLRNVKQILRAGGFDERRYGFGGLIDLLRACQRDGLVRMERDRRGGLRVFQGSAIRPTASPVQQGEPLAAMERETESDAETAAETDVETVEAVVAADPGDLDVIELAPLSVIDTTAELLGRAKPRRPRTRATGAPISGAAPPSPARTPRAAGSQRKPAAKKPAAAARRTTRGKNAPEASNDDRGNR
jgi:uncharacterized LabA/DUF88 family protein